MAPKDNADDRGDVFVGLAADGTAIFVPKEVPGSRDRAALVKAARDAATRRQEKERQAS